MSGHLAAVELLKLVLSQRPTGDIPTKEQIFELYWDCLEAIDGPPQTETEPPDLPLPRVVNRPYRNRGLPGGSWFATHLRKHGYLPGPA